MNAPSERPWTPVLTDDGTYTLASPLHGETCHSRSGAWLESRERYALGCRLRERALAGEVGAAFRVLDVGTGLGWNLAAALEALSGTGVVLHATTLELDASVFAATLALTPQAGEPERWHAPVRAAFARVLERGEVVEHSIEIEGGRLHFVLGDACATLARLDGDMRFDAVFLDAFSPRHESRLWDHAFLGQVARRCASGSWISTYTSAVRVRASLLAHGLCVGPSARVGAKSSGTLATPDREVPSFSPRLERRLRARAAGLAVEAGNPVQVRASNRSMS